MNTILLGLVGGALGATLLLFGPSLIDAIVEFRRKNRA